MAEKLGMSRSAIQERLHLLNIRNGTKKQCPTNPKNYRQRIPPYGFRKINGQLIPYPREMKICRMVVRRIEDKKISYHSMAKELEKQKIKNRSGDIAWSYSRIASIYKRWQGKI